MRDGLCGVEILSIFASYADRCGYRDTDIYPISMPDKDGNFSSVLQTLIYKCRE
jgi:hypothetical protein